MKNCLLFFLCFLAYQSQGQKVHAFFMKDSLEIGKNVALVLVCEHDNKKELIFPSKSSSFAPFAFSSLEYTPTKLQNGKYIDSVIYQLKTFSVDSVIKIRLAISEYKSKQKYYSNTASIRLKSALKKADFENPRMKPIINFYEVPLDINYPKFAYNLLIIGIVLYLIWMFAGKFIIRNIRILLYKKKHRDFLGQYRRIIQNPNVIEGGKKALVAWKNHMQWILNQPISTMTSQEIKTTLQNDRLGETLTYIDGVIFGGQESHRIKFALDNLVSNANENYKIYLEKYIQKLKKK